MFDRVKGDKNRGDSVRQILDDLEGIGVKVTIAPDTHGKLVVIDNRINYWGSLNPLSFRDTDEINTRMDAPELSKKLIQLVRTGRSWPYKVSGREYAEEDVKSDYAIIAEKLLKDLGWSLSGLYHVPRMQVMWNKTIQELITNPPRSWDEYLHIEEISRKNCVLLNHLEQIEDIIYPLRGGRLPPRDRPATGKPDSTLFD
jgi:phosphatidylserine/phosphatidylglycerophosphate/cardiolipin synthase-like enzyme